MFGFRKKKEEVEAPVVHREIVVLGNSVHTLYRSRSIAVSSRLEYRSYSPASIPTSITSKYNNKYWRDPAVPFALGGKDCSVTQVQAVITDDGKAYLLDVSHVIKVEEGMK